MGEEWKDIDGYDGFYQISNKGNVRSLKAVRCIKGKNIIVKRERMMRPFDNGNGYKMVSLSKDSRTKNFYVHRLVASAFLDNPGELEQVNHKDFNRSNNDVSNLEWCTARYNSNYSKCHHPIFHKSTTSSGHKYITLRKGRYRVCIWKKVDRTFNDLNDAIAFRNEAVIWAKQKASS